MPTGFEPDCSADACDFLRRAFTSLYGFQNLPPMTSTISMLYDWKRSSTVPMRGILAGVTTRGSASYEAAEYCMPPSTAKVAPTPIVKYLFLFISHRSVAGSFRRAAIIRDERRRRRSPHWLRVISSITAVVITPANQSHTTPVHLDQNFFADTINVHQANQVH